MNDCNIYSIRLRLQALVDQLGPRFLQDNRYEGSLFKLNFHKKFSVFRKLYVEVMELFLYDVDSAQVEEWIL